MILCKALKVLSLDEAKDIFKRSTKRGPFYKCQDWIFDANNSELFKNAVWQGYLDACRTFKGIKDTGKGEKAFSKLAMAIQNCFTEFKKFDHVDFCQSFVDDLRVHNQGFICSYGQAQKVVNMAFKYLYCCDGSEKYVSVFELCHMPLDSYILGWLKNDGIIDDYKKCWSELSFTEYNKICEGIKGIDKPAGYNTLDIELVLWQYCKNK